MVKKNKAKKQFILGSILIIGVFGLLIFILVTHNKATLKRNCDGAICNQDYTICYKYNLDENGNTVVDWQGNCSVLK